MSGVDFLAYMESGDLESAKTAGKNDDFVLLRDFNRYEVLIL